jgi:hypothetical protein
MQKRFAENFWFHYYCTTPAHSAWSGYAFELACLSHIPQIKHALGISGVLTEASSWRSKLASPGAQIDLVLDRGDRIVNLCEMKYASTEYTIDKPYSIKLNEKRAAFMNETGTRNAVHTTLDTTFGLNHNTCSAEVLFQITGERPFFVTMDNFHLFHCSATDPLRLCYRSVKALLRIHQGYVLHMYL